MSSTTSFVVSYSTDNCIYCNKIFSKGQPYGGYGSLSAALRSPFPNSDRKRVSNLEAINYLTNWNLEIHETEQRRINICIDCTKELRKAYISMKNLEERLKPESKIQCFITNNPSLPPPAMVRSASYGYASQGPCGPQAPLFVPAPLPEEIKVKIERCITSSEQESTSKPSPKKTIRLASAMRSAYASPRPKSRRVLLNTIQLILIAELGELAKSSLLNSEISAENQSTPSKDLYTELERYSPAILSVLKVLFGKRLDKSKDLTPRMRTAMGMAVTNKNMMASLIQKEVGMKLWKLKVTRQPFELLQELGVTVSHHSILRAVDKLRVGSDQILMWKKNITDQLTMLHSDQTEGDEDDDADNEEPKDHEAEESNDQAEAEEPDIEEVVVEVDVHSEGEGLMDHDDEDKGKDKESTDEDLDKGPHPKKLRRSSPRKKRKKLS